MGGVLAGCSGSTTPKGATADTSESASATTSVTNATGATTATGSAPTAGSSAQIGSGDFTLADPRVGLDSLASYRGTLTVSFDGTAAGQQVQWSSTSVLTRISDPASALLTIEQTGDLDAADPDLVAEAAGVAFQRDADGSCTSTELDPEASVLDALEPAAQLAGVVGGESIGSKDIDGAPASGYRFDQRAVGQDGIATTTGEVWTAVNGGYVITYKMSATAGAELFGDGVDGTMSWDYALTDVNASATVDIPPECGTALLNAPLLADATNVVRFDAGLRFDTSSSPADVVAYYQQQSTALGWVVEDEPSSDDKRGTAEFTEGDALITVIALATDGGSNVLIVSGEKPAPASTGATAGQATVVITGGHTANVTWQYVPEFSNPNGHTLTFTDPANPLPAGSFLTIVIGDNISYSDGSATIMAGSDVCTFAIDRQDAASAAGTVTCTGVKALGAGTVDITITFSTGS
jgi:hypothetical protein